MQKLDFIYTKISFKQRKMSVNENGIEISNAHPTWIKHCSSLSISKISSYYVCQYMWNICTKYINS